MAPSGNWVREDMLWDLRHKFSYDYEYEFFGLIYDSRIEYEVSLHDSLHLDALFKVNGQIFRKVWNTHCSLLWEI